VPTPTRRRPQPDQAELQDEPAPSLPYRADTTGLRTDHLPKPPSKRNDGPGAQTLSTSRPAALPPRQPPRQAAAQNPSLPPRRATPGTAAAPGLPPRQNEYPDEHTPPAPPSYGEATQQQRNAATLNEAAVERLGRAGLSVPGLGIGQAPAAATPAPGPQLSELQQRFARMNAGTSGDASGSAASGSLATVAAQKKPPPPPPKKPALTAARVGVDGESDSAAPPPIPLSSKPRS